ncbi:unnamed protein product [Cuscuta campestris]|uniref:Uncharacterized protein n=1 Tax=Cuscuta campestris TaxID=132261 RepID=A0A484KZI6_9ASTE|nr:unnamed protein product [Cuscuta campestris]
MALDGNSSSNYRRNTIGSILQSDPNNDDDVSFRFSTASDSLACAHDRPSGTLNNQVASHSSSWEATWEDSASFTTCGVSFGHLSPWHAQCSPASVAAASSAAVGDFYSYTGLMGSLVREEGHIYSLAASGDLLYTGSDSKNIRVWKNQNEFTGFKSNSGLVKAIIIAGERIFTGHQDGKIRVWKVSKQNPVIHKRIGTLPTFKACIKKSMKPKNYVEVRKNHNGVWIKHFDAISSLTLSEDASLLYSSSWDKTIKVWRIEDSKCLESINAHDDAVNSVVVGCNGLVFSGSADGTVKVWRREFKGKRTKHHMTQMLLKQECAVTSLVIDPSATRLYSGSSDGLVNFWDRDRQVYNHAGVLRGHKLAVLCLAAAGNLVFSGSADTNICVWRREDGGDHVCMMVLNGHAGPVKCLAVEEDGRAGGGDRSLILYSGSLDKSVKIWRVSPQQQQQKHHAAGMDGGVASPPGVACSSAAPSFSSQSSRLHQLSRRDR